MKGMKQLKQSPGVIIDPTKAGDGYWNYKKNQHKLKMLFML